MSKEMRKQLDRIKNWKSYLNENINLLAPNGKKSNLNKIQYNLVRTDNFKQ